MKKVSLLLLAVVMIVACGKKKNAQTEVRPDPNTGIITPDPNADFTVLQGSWETKCFENEEEGTSYRRIIGFNRNVLAYQELDFAHPNCEGDDTVSRQFYEVFRIKDIQHDGVMTHQVDEMYPDGSIKFSWVLRLDEDSFLESHIDFLTTRDADLHRDRYFRK